MEGDPSIRGKSDCQHQNGDRRSQSEGVKHIMTHASTKGVKRIMTHTSTKNGLIRLTEIIGRRKAHAETNTFNPKTDRNISFGRTGCRVGTKSRKKGLGFMFGCPLSTSSECRCACAPPPILLAWRLPLRWCVNPLSKHQRTEGGSEPKDEWARVHRVTVSACGNRTQELRTYRQRIGGGRTNTRAKLSSCGNTIQEQQSTVVVLEKRRNGQRR